MEARVGDAPTPRVLVGLSRDRLPDVTARLVEAPDPSEGDRINLTPPVIETAEDGILLSAVRRKAVVEKKRVGRGGELKPGAQAPDVSE